MLAKSPDTIAAESRKVAEAKAKGEAETSRVHLIDSAPMAVRTLSQLFMQMNSETMKKMLNLIDAVTPTEVQHVKVRRQVLDAFNDQERFMRAAIRRVLGGEDINAQA